MKQQQASPEAHDEGYFASFTDMLVGIIFIFIILLMIFANNYQSATESVTKMSQALDKAREEARDQRRDEERDKARDAARDEARDKARDTARDAARDAAHDSALTAMLKQQEAHAEAKASAEVNAPNTQHSVPKANDIADMERLRAMQQNMFNDSRRKVLLSIQQLLRTQGYAATVDAGQGTLVIPENTLFSRDQGAVNDMGKKALDSLAHGLGKYLPCISPTADSNRLMECHTLGFPPNDGLDVIYIDDYPDTGRSGEDKLLLEVQHIVSIFNALKTADPYLDQGLKNKFGAPILNVKVNQERRTAANQQQNYAPVKNSVVLRFAMRQPTPQDIMRLRNSSPDNQPE
ncbi:MAG: hypothetical protein KGJ06_04325 [Pseudomonadota bacterium]|nr:hypothetical protein [Pseudomonadota bacterium]